MSVDTSEDFQLLRRHVPRGTIFPVGPKKRPACKWSEYESGVQSPRPEDFGPAGHFGLKCGEASGGIVVVDLDVKDDCNGIVTLREMSPTPLPETFTVNTPSGGRHLYFLSDRKHKTTTNVPAKGIDIRAEGGYVVGPGSPGYEVEVDAPVARLPDWLEELLITSDRHRAPRAPSFTPTITKSVQDLQELCKGRRELDAKRWSLVARGHRFVQAKGSTEPALPPDRGSVDETLRSMIWWLTRQDDWYQVGADNILNLWGPSLSLLAQDDTNLGNEVYTRHQISYKWTRACEETAATFAQAEANDLIATALKEAAAQGGPYLIQHGKVFYLKREDGRYDGPITREFIPALVREQGKVRALKITNKGEIPMTTEDLYNEYGAPALDVVVNLSATSASYLRSKSKLVLAPVNFERKAEHSAEIDTWLNLFDPSGLLKTWISLARRLDRLAPVLWLTGDYAAGKTLVAVGIAQLYGKRAPRTLSSELMHDQDLECPIVEMGGLPSDKRQAWVLQALLKRTGMTDHTTRYAPFRPAREVSGVQRVIITTRTLSPLRELSDPSAAEALAERILHIDASPQAAEYIAGREVQGAWVNSGALGRHFAWLCENHEHRIEGRFSMKLPEAATSAVMASVKGVRADESVWPVGDFLAKWIVDTARTGRVPPGDLVQWKDGTVLAAAGAIFERLSEEGVRPNVRSIGRGLRQLSHKGKVNYNTGKGYRKLWQLDIDKLRDFVSHDVSTGVTAEELDAAISALEEKSTR